jgi:hypothetical protein
MVACAGGHLFCKVGPDTVSACSISSKVAEPELIDGFKMVEIRPGSFPFPSKTYQTRKRRPWPSKLEMKCELNFLV